MTAAVGAVLRTDWLDGPAVCPGAASWLTEAERARARAIADSAGRRDFVAAHALVRLVAGQLTGTAPQDLRIVQRCPRCGGPHGRPEVGDRPDLSVSLGHTCGAVIAAAATGPVGADIESLRRPRFDLTLADDVLTGPERRAVRAAADSHRAFLLQWARKEAAVKAGLGTLARLAEIDLGHLPVSGAADGSPAAAPLGPDWPRLRLLDQIDEDNEVAFAIVSPGRLELIDAQSAFPQVKGR